MAEPAPVSLTAGLPETVLPPPPSDAAAALRQALAGEPSARKAAVTAVAAAHPRLLDAWAVLAEESARTGNHVESYAYARVGYHRGLDALRAAGWRGSGFVRASHDTNQGFLRALEALRHAAEVIGETDEQQRCAVFLHQLDPDLARSA